MVIERLNTANDDTLTTLQITPYQRADEIRKLTYKNYFRGPSPDHADPSKTWWEFGTVVKGYEIYIKLQIYEISGKKRGKCLSFHIASWSIKYPFR